jgi:hypothetical protein
VTIVNFLVVCCTLSFLLLGKSCNKPAWRAAAWIGAAFFVLAYKLLPNEDFYLLLAAYGLAVGIILEKGTDSN